MKKKTPKITLLMPAYNCEEYVAKAIQSVLEQTFTDFELIVMDDGSTDTTLNEIERISDPRIVVQKNKHNFIATLNRGLLSASGQYLARMDADDLIPADRLAIQYRILEDHPEIEVCGGWMQLFGKNVKQQVARVVFGYITHPLLLMLRNNFIYNATTMCRMAFIRKHKLSYKPFAHAEDYFFWCEAARCGARFFVEPQVLYYYRMWKNQVGRVYQKEQKESSVAVRKEVVGWLVGEKKLSDIVTFYKQASTFNQTGILSDEAFIELFYQIFETMSYLEGVKKTHM